METVRNLIRSDIEAVDMLDHVVKNPNGKKHAGDNVTGMPEWISRDEALRRLRDHAKANKKRPPRRTASLCVSVWVGYANRRLTQPTAGSPSIANSAAPGAGIGVIV